MKILKIALLFVLLSITACRKDPISTVIENNDASAGKGPLKKDTVTHNVVYDPSTFSDPNDHFDVRDDLRELNNAEVFDSIHLLESAKLSDVHLQALKKLDTYYKILYVADGSLFAPGNKDKAIVAYQPAKEYLAILLYNDSNKSMGELYSDYKVENGLKNANCNYSAFGTLDYQLAAEIVYFKEHLLKSPKSFLENTPCLITDFSKNENYAPDGGCLSSKTPKLTGNLLCIATSFVYNNWECLKYNKETKSFLICYGQAFSD